MKSAARSTALASASASSAQVPINEPDLPKNFNESRGDKTGIGIEDQSKIYPSLLEEKNSNGEAQLTKSRQKSSHTDDNNDDDETRSSVLLVN
jgi:hypothetical protein